MLVHECYPSHSTQTGPENASTDVGKGDRSVALGVVANDDGAQRRTHRWRG